MARDEELAELEGDDNLEGDNKLDELDELEGYRELSSDDLGDKSAAAADDDEDEDTTGSDTTTEGEGETSPPEIEEDPDEEEEESLEALLGTDATVTEASPRVAGARAPEGIGEDEFTCRSCFLVKSRAQLADADALICYDCE